MEASDPAGGKRSKQESERIGAASQGMVGMENMGHLGHAGGFQ